MEGLFLKLLNMSITAAYVFTFVFILRLFLKRAPKWISYALWSLMLFRLVCPVSFSSDFSVFGRLGGAGPSAQLDGMAFIEPVAASAAAPASAPISGAGGSLASLPASSASAAAGLSGTGISAADPMQMLIFIGMCVWLTGIAVMLIYGAASYLKLKRRVSEATRVEGNVFETDAISAPFVFGLTRPRIYLPVSLDGTGRDFVLRHERAHIRRGDQFIKPLAFLALSVHWFNPFVWLAFVLMGRDMEMSCDERVIRELEPEARAGYGETLAGLAAKRPLLAGSPLAFGESGVKTRVRNVLSYRRPAFWVIAIAVIAAAAVGICLLTNPEKSAISDGEIVSAQFDGAELPKELYTELAAMIDSYGRSHWNINTSPITRSDGLFGEPDYTITLNMADGSAYTLKKYYTNAWSLFRGEFGYRYILGFEEAGSEVKAWRMPDSFSCAQELGDWENRMHDALSVITDISVGTSLEAAVIGFMEDGWWYGGELLSGEKHPGTFKASSFVTLLWEETERGLVFYGVSLYRSYNVTQISFSVAESFQCPCVITLDKATLACLDFWVPGDGAYFEMDIYAKFPEEIAEEAALRYVDYFDRQAAACDDKARSFGGFVDTIPLLTVTSDSTTVLPYENFLWSNTYAEDIGGWLSADGISIFNDLGAVLAQLPMVTLREDFTITCAEGVSHHGVTVVAGESLEVLYRNADMMILTALPEGQYYVSISVSKQGDYVAAGGDYESEGYECVFRYVVNEYSYEKMLMSQPVHDKVCMMVRLTGDGGINGYIVPKNQDAWLSAWTYVLDQVEKGVLWKDTETSLGIWVMYQDEWCQFMDSGALVIPGAGRVEAGDAAALYALAEPIAKKHSIGVFRPDMINGVISAMLKTSSDSVATISAETLSKLESLLSNAKEFRGGSACPFDALLTLETTNGVITIALATDGCPIYMVNGVCFEYEASDNTELYALFHVTLPTGLE
jgi:beta-lactamase regulating signal transducer with metallopeptidase domain